MDVKFEKLVEADIRDAWQHEAHHFTPWLVENLDGVSDAIGLKLEAEGSEVAVETFSADILARNTLDDTRVLIENQLGGSDHTHLGQIMTYLAGLDAKTIIWIATAFREPHLSAIKWLNQHTDSDFSFFAIKVKVVRIGDSPFAPIFEVLERPNEWERQLHAVTSKNEVSEDAQRRKEFWESFVKRVPGELERSGKAQAVSNRWRVLPEYGLVISLMAAKGVVGIFYRQLRGANPAEARERLAQKEELISEKLGVPLGTSSWYFFGDELRGDYNDPLQQDDLIDWLALKADLYARTIKELGLRVN